MSDARFEDGAERALTLMAADEADLTVISSLVQDAVFPITEMTWDKGQRRFAILMNRFRWEDAAASGQAKRPVERVQTVLVINDVKSVASQGVDRGERDMVLSLLSLMFEPGEDGQGDLVLTLSGDGAIRVQVECLDLVLRDVTRPYVAPSGRRPAHPD